MECCLEAVGTFLYEHVFDHCPDKVVGVARSMGLQVGLKREVSSCIVGVPTFLWYGKHYSAAICASLRVAFACRTACDRRAWVMGTNTKVYRVIMVTPSALLKSCYCNIGGSLRMM